MKETRETGLSDITAAFEHSPIDELIVLTPPAGTIQLGQGLLLRHAERAKHRNSGPKPTQEVM